jgi:hypothetical protein
MKKSHEEFHRWYKGDGYQPWCKACRKEYDAAYFQANKHRRKPRRRDENDAFRRWYAGLKAGPCQDCGGTFAPGAMHWDHRPGENKIADVGWLATRRNRQRILDEIAKCDLVCANCHAVRTAERWRAA